MSITTKQLELTILGGRYTMDFDPVALTIGNVVCVAPPPDIPCKHYRKGLCTVGLLASPENCLKCKQYDGPSRGKGDTFRKFTNATGIHAAAKFLGCGGCEDRQIAWNEAKPSETSERILSHAGERRHSR